MSRSTKVFIRAEFGAPVNGVDYVMLSAPAPLHLDLQHRRTTERRARSA
jgi:hypothetical protein